MTTECPPNVAPPGCCQPPMSAEVWTERGRRWRAAFERNLTRQPKACPSCGSDEIAPVFDPDGAFWTCDSCSYTFDERSLPDSEVW